MISPALLGLMLCVTQTVIMWTRPESAFEHHDEVTAVTTEDWSRGLELLHAAHDAAEEIEEDEERMHLLARQGVTDSMTQPQIDRMDVLVKRESLLWTEAGWGSSPRSRRKAAEELIANLAEQRGPDTDDAAWTGWHTTIDDQVIRAEELLEAAKSTGMTEG